MKKPLPSVDIVQKLLWADFFTGRLVWLPRASDFFTTDKQTAEHNRSIWNGRYAGKDAFTAIDSVGYRTGSLFDIKVRAHTVILAMHLGEWPTRLVDHINQDKLDNRLCNLRLADKSLNARNSKIRLDNTSGHRGVTWVAKLNKWMAQATRDGHHHYLGVFGDIKDAIDAKSRFDSACGD